MLSVEESIPVLIQALQSTLVRKEAAEALSALGSKAAIPPLFELFKKEQDENIRFYVKDTLTRLGWNPNRVRL